MNQHGEITIEEWRQRRTVYLTNHPKSLAAVLEFCVFWEERVRKSDLPAMPKDEWNLHFLDYLLHFYLPGNP